ncbi:hypothetical protein KY360_05620 [Candidatus Woesearchaeota archaeon]|nr:hypothetical protein [Candidatus Woesearchaeota archaeon]
MKLFEHKKERKRVNKPERAGREALDALNRLKQDWTKKSPGENSEKFFNIVRKFLSDYFSITYEFTPDEFSRDIKRKRGVEDKIKERVVSFSQELSDMKYKYKDLSEEQIEKAIDDFKSIVSFLMDKKKHETVHEQMRRLTDYVRFALEKGKTKVEIEQALIDAGWPVSVVKRELEKVK